jgi:hypothetical protein
VVENSDDASSRKAAPSPRRGRNKSSMSPLISAELAQIEQSLHPMLAVMFIECPHTFTIDMFARFLMWCVKALRRVNHHETYLIEHTAADGSGRSACDVLYEKATVEMGIDEDVTDDDINTLTKEKQLDEEIRNVSKFTSCVTRTIGKLLMIAENYQPGDIANKRNYEVLTDLLRCFLRLGKEEEMVLLKLGGLSVSRASTL